MRSLQAAEGSSTPAVARQALRHVRRQAPMRAEQPRAHRGRMQPEARRGLDAADALDHPQHVHRAESFGQAADELLELRAGRRYVGRSGGRQRRRLSLTSRRAPQRAGLAERQPRQPGGELADQVVAGQIRETGAARLEHGCLGALLVHEHAAGHAEQPAAVAAQQRLDRPLIRRTRALDEQQIG